MQARVPPLLVAAAIGALMFFVARSPFALTFETGVNDALGFALMTVGAAVDVLAVVQFRRHGTTVDPRHPAQASTLLTSGVFAVSRNPIYLGMLVILIGVGVQWDSAAAVLLALCFVPLITVSQIRAEEAAMRALFGDAWDDYAARVRRWL